MVESGDTLSREKIAFHQTRMLIDVMGVTGMESTYRRTCKRIMHVLHRNIYNLMAVQELAGMIRWTQTKPVNC
ncbi:hypothetical protein quinque_013175 [Culex quinquefasciatus]